MENKEEKENLRNLRDSFDEELSEKEYVVLESKMIDPGKYPKEEVSPIEILPISVEESKKKDFSLVLSIRCKNIKEGISRGQEFSKEHNKKIGYYLVTEKISKDNENPEIVMNFYEKFEERPDVVLKSASAYYQDTD